MELVQQHVKLYKKMGIKALGAGAGAGSPAAAGGSAALARARGPGARSLPILSR